jgi:hippurate hydrolase
MTNSLSSEVISEAASWRRHLHRHPELAYREHKTADFIASQLTQFGLSVHRGLAGTGVVGTLSRGTSRRVIAIRADMDALPIQEYSGAPHASAQPGVMHACGHDGHVTMALAAARICAAAAHLDGTVHFIFQPAEENEGGGRRMVEDGLFRLFPTDAIYALHNWPSLPVGCCVARDGAMMAAFAVFEIVISGRGCHSALPHEGTDTILVAAQLISALHTLTSRNIDPLEAGIVSATQIHAGDTWNVIPASCTIRGTTRWFDDGVGATLERRILDLSSSIASGFGCEARVEYDRRYPATINDPSAAKLIRSLASASGSHLEVLDTRPSMASEDFSFMLQHTPGCYFWLGAARGAETPGLHSPHYDFNDELLPVGIKLWVSLVKQALAGV